MRTTQQSRPGNPEAARKACDGAGNSLAAESRCLCCRRPLSDPVSVRRGYGPRCFARLDALGIGSVIA